MNDINFIKGFAQECFKQGFTEMQAAGLLHNALVKSAAPTHPVYGDISGFAERIGGQALDTPQTGFTTEDRTFNPYDITQWPGHIGDKIEDAVGRGINIFVDGFYTPKRVQHDPRTSTSYLISRPNNTKQLYENAIRSVAAMRRNPDGSMKPIEEFSDSGNVSDLILQQMQAPAKARLAAAARLYNKNRERFAAELKLNGGEAYERGVQERIRENERRWQEQQKAYATEMQEMHEDLYGSGAAGSTSAGGSYDAAIAAQLKDMSEKAEEYERILKVDSKGLLSRWWDDPGAAWSHLVNDHDQIQRDFHTLNKRMHQLRTAGTERLAQQKEYADVGLGSSNFWDVENKHIAPEVQAAVEAQKPYLQKQKAVQERGAKFIENTVTPMKQLFGETKAQPAQPVAPAPQPAAPSTQPVAPPTQPVAPAPQPAPAAQPVAPPTQPTEPERPVVAPVPEEQQRHQQPV